jgi:hypothetical protein
MSEEDNKYKTSKIYKLCSHQTKKIYVGSTTQKLCNRFANHISSFKAGRKITSRHLIKYDDCTIDLIENFPCENKDQLHRRERYYIETLNCVNKYIPTRTSLEYRFDNKDKIKEYKKQNKEQIKEYKKQIVECPLCKCNSTKGTISKHNKTKKHLNNKEH